MASSRIYEEASAETHVRAFVDRVRASGRLDGLISKVGFLTQPQEVSCAMLQRVVHSDPLFGPVLIKKLSQVAERDQPSPHPTDWSPIEFLGAEESRRFLTCISLSLLAAIVAPKCFSGAQAIIREAYAISFVAGRISAGSKFTSSESGASLAASHALGRIAMLATYEEEYLAPSETNEEPLCQIERERFGLDHAEAGALFMSRFGFALVPTEAISLHHQPITEIKEFPQIVCIAEQTAIHLGFGQGRAEFDAERLKPWLLRLGEKPESLPDWKSRIETGLQNLA